MPSQRVTPPHPTDAQSRHDDRYPTHETVDDALADKADASIADDIADLATEVDGKQAALTVGSVGNVQVSNGTSLVSVTAGVIDVRQRGAVGDDSTDNTTLLTTLINAAASSGATLYFPDGIYRANMLPMLSNLHITGSGTIKMRSSSPGESVFQVTNANSDNVSIEGVTLDGNGVARLIRAAEYPRTHTNWRIRHVTMQNTSATYERDTGIDLFFHTDLVVEYCIFSCAAPVRGANLNNVKFRNNHVIAASVLNAFDIISYDGFVMRGLEFTNNDLRGLYRMGIELVRGNSNGWFDAPLIANNYIEIATTHHSEAFGVSINDSPGALISGNHVNYLGSVGTYPTYAYEVVVSRGVRVLDNEASNVLWGVSVNNSPETVVDSNRINHCVNGIELPSGNPNSTACTVTRNIIKDCEDVGIWDGYNNSTLSGGNVITDNVISRSVAWADDATTSFFGIYTFEQSIPSQYCRNRIEQGQTAPTGGFAFYGIVAAGGLGLHDDSKFLDNIFIDRKTGGAMMAPLVAMSGGAALADAVTTGNILADDDGTKSNANTWPL